ncbi:hypothetical protein [uncultured Microbacterium sp.]|uniref:hypothetical protein n=1 Tax=uncultured Microbacterium sp. TaxID=191216 RepID=UPI0025E17193|nr:hypothetical protein [uncultured Microbacterium sp.]
MFSDLAALRTALKARLKPQLPADWQIVEHISSPRDALVPVVYFEFTGFDSTAGGQQLPRQQVAATVDVVVTTTRTDDEGIAETEADNLALRLVQAVVQSDDLFFSTARKTRLDSGPYGWRVTLTALTNIAPSEGA